MPEERISFLNVRPEERKLVFSLVFILTVTTLVLELSDVIATGGFVSKVGSHNIFWLWIVDMLISLITAGGYALAVDRMERVRLIKYLMLAFAILFILLRFVFAAGVPDWVSYPILYILTDQFYAIFPLAFWAMVNDLYTTAEGKRLFPIITMGTALGSILGNGLAALSGWILRQSDGDPASLLPMGSLLLLFGLVMLELVFAKLTVNARQSRENSFDLRQTISVGMDYVKNVPIFTYLAISMLFSGVAFTVIEYHFLFSVDQSAAQDPLQFQAFYGIFKVVLIISTLVVQAFVSGKLLERVGLKGSFIIQPIALAVGAGLSFLVSGLYGAAGARYVARLVQQAWDEPARKSLENLVPDERRGRVAVMLDRYLYDISTIGASLFLGLLVLAGSRFFPAQTLTYVYIGVAVAASCIAIWAGFRTRARYDQSMLDWRLSRSRRKSVLSGIEF
ncbi:MAG: Npt1/Npt2 family nucleotide transporter [Chloroflexota bacterium]|nr:Npt1/Npt2 family nucleotide transporter [Anaerolineales bacterium]